MADGCGDDVHPASSGDNGSVLHINSTAVTVIACGVLAVLIGACGSSSAKSPSSSGVPAGAGCVTQSQAQQIWTDIDTKLNAMEADPGHATPSTVTTGAALTGVQQYLQQQLIANKWTEKEVDKLDSLSVVSAGCNNGSLQVKVTMTLVTDEYLTASGAIDHHDPTEGQTLHFMNSYQRSGGSWKEDDFVNLDQPQPSQNPTII